MTWEDDGIVVEREYLVTELLHQQVVVAAREVGTSYAAAEEGVAREDHLGIVCHIAEAAYTMARHITALDGVGSDGESVAPLMKSYSMALKSDAAKPIRSAYIADLVIIFLLST